MRADTLGGIVVILIGALGLWAGIDLDRGTAFRMGPGYLPALLAWAIMGLGVIIAVTSFFKPGDPLPPLPLRPLLFVCAALFVFGLTINRLGIVVAVLLLVGLASLASSITRHRETPFLALALAACSALVFVVGLGLAIPLWPR